MKRNPGFNIRDFFLQKILKEKMVRPAGFEPTAPRLGILCSILLSYGRLFQPSEYAIFKQKKIKILCGKKLLLGLCC